MQQNSKLPKKTEESTIRKNAQKKDSCLLAGRKEGSHQLRKIYEKQNGRKIEGKVLRIS